MKKLKLFLENFLVYGVGGVISKIIPLIMLPIITRIMPTAEYFGINDLSNTIVSFASALAIMGMYDAMYRMFFESDEIFYKKTVCATTLVFTIFTSLIIFFLLIVFRETIAAFFFNDRKLAYVVYLSAVATLVGATNGIISAPTRMQNKRKIYLIANTVSPILSYSIAIYLLLKGHYVIALPLAAVISGIIMEISFGLLNKQWFQLKLFDRSMLKQLIAIALPLLPNFLVYWVFGSCDKIMITNLIGMGATGIYSVGAKLGHASHLIYIAFAGGWQYFAFSTMKEENQVKSNSIVFEYLGAISFAVTGFMCAWSCGIYKILFTEEYLGGYIIAPYLFLAPLLQMLFQVAANQFLVVKKTWPNMFILSTGALLNIVINYMLIPKIGIEGAALATLLGYAVSDAICVIVLYRMNLIVISKQFCFIGAAFVFFLISWRLLYNNRIIVGTVSAFLLTGIIVLCYKSDLMRFLQLIKKRDLRNE